MTGQTPADAGHTPANPYNLWEETKAQLRHQMTAAAYNQWLAGSRGTVLDGQALSVAVKSPRAVEWLSGPLMSTMAETLARVAGRPLDIVLWAVETDAALGPKNGVLAPLSDPPTPETAATFRGFQPIDSNFTLCPDLFFDEVVPNADGSVTKIVATVIRQTLGTFEDKRHHRRREEWPINQTILAQKAGISSRSTMGTALWDARAEGYLIYRPVDGAERISLSEQFGYQVFGTLRIRFQDEPVDYPTESRPRYGSGRKR